MKKEYIKFHPKTYRNPVAKPMGVGRRLRFHPDYKMDKEDYDELVKQFSADGAKTLKAEGERIENALNTKWQSVIDGTMKKEDFEKFKAEEMKALNDTIAKMEKSQGENGIKIQQILDAQNKNNGGNVKSLEQYIKELMPRIAEQRKTGAGIFEITSSELREAGVVNFRGGAKAASTTAVGAGTVGGTNGSIVDMGTSIGSPYLPGLGGSDLELFEIVRNPNWILNRVDVGRTDQFRLAWINEVDYQGTPGMDVAESGTKPLTQHKFQVEFSTAKKAAARIALTEEFEQDVPGLASAVRRMLQQDVMRDFDTQIQTQVAAAARPYEITGLNGAISKPNLFDAAGALLAQVGYYNFTPNTLAMNSVTDWNMMMSKDANGQYLNPPFMDRINRLLVDANKLAVGYGLAGDLSQYKVDIYKDFVLKVGWINEQFINNEFSIVGELRYHSYISDNRKKAIVYNQLSTVLSTITTAGGS